MTTTTHLTTAITDHRGAAGLRALRVAATTNLAIAAAHVAGLTVAWRMFRWAGIEPDMRALAEGGAALPYVATLVAATGFLVFGLYGLAGAGRLRPLPLLRPALIAIAAVCVARATLLGGVEAVADGDGAQIAFAAIALLIGAGYGAGAVAAGRH